MGETLSREVDHLGFIRRTLGELTGYERLTFELIQNADDTQRATYLRFDVRDEALWVEDDGGFSDCGNQKILPDKCPFFERYGHRCDFHSFRSVSSADKRLREDTTGAFGIGFTAVYQVTDRPEIISGIRHWRVDETASKGRINQELLDTPYEGTKIILPWARDRSSEFRQRVEVSTVSENVEAELIASLEESVVSAMLFLRNLRSIEIARNGVVVRTVTREVDGQTVLIDDGEEAQLWRLLEGDFEKEAVQLRVQHVGQLDLARKSKVTVAIPMDFDVDGRLCSTLPTEKSIDLPVHVNGELYLTSDRRQLEMGTPHHSDWNSAVIEAAARLLAGSLQDLPALLGPGRLWRAIESARNLSRGKGSDALSRALASFWERLEPEIPHRELVWTNDQRWKKVSESRLVQSAEDEEALEVLGQLGVTLVDSSLRAHQNILLAVGVKRLGFDDIASALRQAGLTRCIPLDRLPKPLDDTAARDQLWAQLGRMLGRLRPGDLFSARAALEGTAIVPSTDGHLCPPEKLWHADQRSVGLLSIVAPAFPFLDAELLREDAKLLAKVCDELTPSDAVDQLSYEVLEVDVALARDLIGWLAQREEELDDEDLERLAGLRIFPSANGVHTLQDVALAGDFDDPLKLAQLVDAATARDYGSFLRRLDIRELSFAVYAGQQVPRVFMEGDLTLQQRREIVSLLAREHLRLDDDPQARTALAGVPLVECLDGTWHPAGRVYFDHEPVRLVLGDHAKRARLPQEHTQATEALLTWLGVTGIPRASDVIARVEELSNREPNETRRGIVQNIVSWLGRGWRDKKPSEQEKFASFRNMTWLPARKGGGWHRPSDLDLVFQDYLYESVGRFLGIHRQVQEQATDFLRWLGVSQSPRVEQVVAHLRYCAESNTVPNREIYNFLNNNATELVVRKLRDAKCLHLGNRWCRPDEVYWSHHPFGRWRFQLGHDLARYDKLFGTLGVKETPDHTDALGVIDDISAEYSEYSKSVSEEDLKVLQDCWELCETALRDGDLEPAELVTFGKQKVIADSDKILTPASHLFFEDLPGLGDELPDVRRYIINRPGGAWRAMRAAGVRDLSKVARAHVADIGGELDEGEVRERILDREEELARVITPRVDVSWRQLAERIRNLNLTVVTSMVVVWELYAFNRRFPGKPRQADALWQLPEEKLYVATVHGDPVWEAVAREIVRALLPELEPATLALDIAAALRPDDRGAAKRALDAAGFPALAVEVSAQITTARVEDIDATHIDRSEVFSIAGEPEVVDEESEGDSGADTEDAGDVAQGDRETTAGDNQHDVEDDDADSTEEEAKDARRLGSEDREGNEGSGISSGNSAPSSRSRGRLRSYVMSVERDETHEASDDGRVGSIDEAGMEAVRLLEIQAGRRPERQAHHNPGYDVTSYRDGIEERTIEVKSTAGPWGGMGVGLSERQFSYAQKLGDQFWLYVVEYALDPERQKVWTIQNPASRVTDFMFDAGWKDATADESESDSLRERRRIRPSPRPPAE